MAAQRSTRVSDCGVYALCTVDDARPWQTSVQVTLGMAHCMLSRHWLASLADMALALALLLAYIRVLPPNKLSRALSV
jgi:hypothetical protein